jgi:hypothetical protein
LPNWIEQPEWGGVNWTGADLVADNQVDVQPPAQTLVERLGAVHVGDRQGHDLEIHVHAESALRLAGLTAYIGATHDDLLRLL